MEASEQLEEPAFELVDRGRVSSQRPGRKPSIDAKDAETLRKGLVQLVLQLVELLRQLMERQAIRRMPSLPPEKQEQLGLHLMLLKEKMQEMREYFGIEKEQLELGLLRDLEELANSPLRAVASEIDRN